jgi:hypothetical protein
MHNLHFIRTNAVSAEQACEKIDQQFNGEKEKLDFSKLDVNAENFKELDSPFLTNYSEEDNKSFTDYLIQLIDPNSQTNMWHLEDALDGDTFTSIRNFLETAGYEIDSEDNLFDVTVLGALNEDDTDRYSYESGKWDFSDYSKSDIDQILSTEMGEEINCFGDIEEDFYPLDEIGIRDLSEDSELPKFVVMLDINS